MLGRTLAPEAQLAGPIVLKASSFLAAGVGFGAVAYYLVVFTQSRELRDALLAGAFAGIAAGGALQAVSGSIWANEAVSDRITLIAWAYSGFLFAGSAYSSSILRRGGPLRSLAQVTVVSVAVAAFPIVLSGYVFDASLHERIRAFPTLALSRPMENATASIAAMMITLAVVHSGMRLKEDSQRLDRVLSNFYLVCVIGLACRGAAESATQISWFCGQILVVSAWLVMAAGFSAESALTHKELVDRLRELEALHDVSWSLVGSARMDNFLHVFLDLLRQRTGAEIASIYRADEQGQSLELAAVSGAGEEYARVGTTYLIASEDRRPGFHTGHTAAAFKSCEMRTSDDVFIDPEFVPWRVIARGDGRAVSLPLIENAVAFGVLNVYFRDRRQVPKQSIRLLTTIAAAAGPAIANIWSQGCERKTEEDRLDRAA